MADIVEKLRLKGMAEEDMYFAQHDLELIDALHERQLASLKECDEPSEKERAKGFEARYRLLAETHEKAEHESKSHELLRGLRELLLEIKEVCRREN